MNRTKRATMAKQTVAICDAGFYEPAKGIRVSIADALAKAKAGTVLYSLERPPITRAPKITRATRFEVKNETAFQALARLAVSGSGHPACLNFASAKNPGGGFLNGSV